MKLSRRTILIIISVILVLFLFSNAGFRRMIRRYWEIHTLKTELINLKRENMLLEREVYFLEKNESYIERIARKELGLIAPGEIEYRFEKDRK